MLRSSNKIKQIRQVEKVYGGHFIGSKKSGIIKQNHEKRTALRP